MEKTSDNTLALLGGDPICDDESEIYGKWPPVTTKDFISLAKVLDERDFSGRGSKVVKNFEEKFSKYNGSKYTITVNSGTSAIHASLIGLGIKEGDEVITTAFSFIASALPVTYCGGKPVFVDIDPKTYNIDPDKIEEKITERTKALIIVHFQGLPADMDKIVEICKKHNLALIEDCAQATGARYKGVRVGNFGEFGAFSIMSGKQLAACGEGGLVTCNSLELKNAVNKARIFGEYFDDEGNRSYYSDSLGYNFVFNPIQAAFVTNRLEDYPRDLKIIQDNAQMLSRFLERIPFIEPPYVGEGFEHVYQYYRIKICPEKANLDISADKLTNAIAEALNAEGLTVRRYQTIPLPGQKIFETLGVCKKDEYLEYKNTIEVIKTTLVIGGKGSAPHYFYSTQTIEKYMKAFKKIQENIDQLIEYAKDKTYPLPWEVTKGFTDTGKFNRIPLTQ